jgi:hypothetical protein
VRRISVEPKRENQREAQRGAQLAPRIRARSRCATNQRQPRANHGIVSSFGSTTPNSQCVRNKLIA